MILHWPVHDEVELPCSTVTTWTHEPPAIVLLPDPASITSLSWRHHAGGQSQGHVIVSRPARHAPCTTDALFAILLTTTSLRQLSVCLSTWEHAILRRDISATLFKKVSPILDPLIASGCVWSTPESTLTGNPRPITHFFVGRCGRSVTTVQFLSTGQIGRFPKTCVVSVAINTGRSVCVI